MATTTRCLLLAILVPTVAYASFNAAVGAYHAVWRHPPGYRGGSPWGAFLVAYVLLAILSVLYVRSAPRSARHPAGHEVKNDA